MNIDNLTFGELKKIAALFTHQSSKSTVGAIGNQLVGKYCIARCYSAGVHAGIVDSVDGENVVLRDSRRLWSWKAQDGIALSGVAQNGLFSADSKLDTMNPVIYLTGVCELIPCSSKAMESINDA